MTEPGGVKGQASAAARAVTGQSRIVKLAELAAFVALAIWLVSLATRATGNTEPSFPAHGPAEFLYLDSARAIAYLAQFDGGTFSSETLSNKLTNTVSGKASLDALELGGSSAREELVSKQITPTAAANYIELLEKLEGLPKGLKTIGLGRFDHEIHDLTEGQFVTFRTHALRSPIYLNPYLALRQSKTLSTLFPMPSTSAAKRERTRRQRAAAKKFRARVGKDPRVVFALRPLDEKELEERRNGKAPRSYAAAQPLIVGKTARRLTKKQERREAEEREEAENHVQYLMPIDAQLLTEERSLIKFGGGEFTVVGKVVRIFPEHGDGHQPAYVDSPTVETWAQPLAEAPLQLLCRTDPKCTAKLHAENTTRVAREKAIRKSRDWAIETLEEQTQIPRRGAVILPIAIYK